MHKAAVKNSQPDQARKPKFNGAKIIGVVGAKGGVGATTLSVELAAVLALSYGHTTVVDGDLQHADVWSALGCTSEYSVEDLVERIDGLDESVFSACCSSPFPQASKLRVLGQAVNAAAIPKINLTDLARVVQKCSLYTEFFLLDLPRHIDKHLVTAADLCDTIVLVFEATVAGVTMVTRWLSLFHELGYEDDRIICVLNRAGGKYTTVEKELHRCLGERDIVRIPNASSILWECAARPVPAVLAYASHPYSRAVARLAERLQQPRQKGGEEDV